MTGQTGSSPLISKGHRGLIRFSGCEDSNRTGDVIFVHGLGGDAIETWHHNSSLKTTDNKPDDNFWFTWLSQEPWKIGIWTFGYEAEPSKWKGQTMPLFDQASNLLEWIESRELGNNQLMFITHSMGGLLVKEMLRTAKDNNKQKIIEQVKGIVFLATPHKGADLANYINKVSVLVRASISVEELQAHNPNLRSLNDWYVQNARNLSIITKVYYETIPVSGGILVVDADSANVGIEGVKATAIPANHIDIVKPKSKDDSLVYLGVKKFIKDCFKLYSISEILPPKPNRYQDIIKNFISGNVIPFLGPGINPSIYLDLASKLTTKVGKLLFVEQEWSNFKNDTEKRIAIVKKMMGIPIGTCPLSTIDRPGEEASKPCPLVEGVERNKTNPLYLEQELVIAKMNCRYLAQYWKLKNQRPVDTFYDEIIELCPDMIKQLNDNELEQLAVHKFLAQLPKAMGEYPQKTDRKGLPYPIIITTSYDSFLEQAFHKYDQNVDTLYYKAAYQNDQGQLIHQEGDKDPIKEEYNKLPVRKRPVILRLYGNWNDQFVVTNDQFYSLLRDLKNLPVQLETVLNNSSFLFLGYSPNDYELQMIVDGLKNSKKIGTENKSWLIHQSQAGDLTEQFWTDRKIYPISIQGNLEDFVKELQKGIDEEIKLRAKKG
jgi:predicted alpha/beta hydrolase family esterase